MDLGSSSQTPAWECHTNTYTRPRQVSAYSLWRFSQRCLEDDSPTQTQVVLVGHLDNSVAVLTRPQELQGELKHLVRLQISVLRPE